MSPRVAPQPYSVAALNRIVAGSAPSGECWEWTRSKDYKGYGQVQLGSVLTGNRGTYRVHRCAYQILVCELPDDLELDHLCRNRACWRPDHLEPVPHRVNVLRGESPSAFHSRKTHCPAGHEYNNENTYVIPSSGSRVCRTCKRENNRKKHRSAATV